MALDVESAPGLNVALRCGDKAAPNGFIRVIDEVTGKQDYRPTAPEMEFFNSTFDSLDTRRQYREHLSRFVNPCDLKAKFLQSVT